MLKVNFTLLILFIVVNLQAQTYKVEDVSVFCTSYVIKGINSKYDDFSPSVVNDQLIFTSGRETDLVLSGENNWKNTGFMNLFVADLTTGWSDTSSYRGVAPYSNILKTFNHTGPACFTSTGDTIFYTQVAPKKKQQNTDRKPQLFMANRLNSEWKNLVYLPFNQVDFSYGHPAWDVASNTLYFVSDMSGGSGGTDIYSVSFNDGNWGKIVNVSDINTEYDEVFPNVVLGDIYFSSNRPGGKGKMDLYWKIIGDDSPVKNLASLNSEFDEIGIVVSSDRTKGFYSSNSTGNDDIHFFYMERSVTLSNEMAGQFTYRNLGGVAGNLQIQLFSEEGEMLFEQKTDENGQFQFKSLPGESYTIKAVSENDLELILFDSKGNATTYLLRDSQGAFQYKKIDFASAGTLSLIDESMSDFELKSGWISGQFAYEDQPGEYPDSLKVMLISEEGNIVFSQNTDMWGNFDFKKLSLTENYILTTEEIDQNLVLFIFDKEGNVIAQLKQNENGSFVYRKIKADFATNLQALAENEDVFEYNTMTITGNFDYKKLDGQFNGGLEVLLYSEEGEFITSTYTDERGEFRFTSLDPTMTYLFKINEDNPAFELNEFNLHVVDRYGKVIAELYHEEKGFFTFRKLGVIDQPLALIKENEIDFSLEDKQAIIIFFEKNSSYPAVESYHTLVPIIDFLKNNPTSSVEISAYADSRANSDYNLFLSEKRGNRIKDYMIKRGVNPSRIIVNSYGESKLANACGDNVLCPEEEHARNRRFEVVLKN